MEGKNYLEHRFVLDDKVGNGVIFKLECKKAGKWEIVDDCITQHYALNGRLFYKKSDAWWMCEVDTMNPECLGSRYFEGSFFCLDELFISFFTQDASFKRIKYDSKVVIDYNNNLLFCKKEDKYDVYKIGYYPGFVASCCLVLRFGSPTEILHVNTENGKLHLRSRLNPDKTSYWQEVDIRPWYTKMYQRLKKALA